MKFKLDVSKWRSGDEGAHQVGRGMTSLVNFEGYSCCLGQFLGQLGQPVTALLNKPMPASCSNVVPPFSIIDDLDRRSNTPLSHHLSQINDDPRDDIPTRIGKIKARLELDGHELEVINYVPA